MRRPAVDVRVVRVFPLGETGGNPAPIVLDAQGLTGDEMRRIAAAHGHESGFVLPADPDSGADLRLRFFVPWHEMEMCGHATIGALWLLRAAGRVPWSEPVIQTLSGPVHARVPGTGAISVSQPAGEVRPLGRPEAQAVCDALAIDRRDLAHPEILNATTSRTKTLIPLAAAETLHRLVPEVDRVAAACAAVGSTGLYPFAAGAGRGVFHARQFPKGSGYPEDAATGIAAAALAYGLAWWGLASRRVADGDGMLRIRQGEAMGRPSEIRVSFDGGDPALGCWIAGECA